MTRPHVVPLMLGALVLLIALALVAGCLHRRPFPPHVVPPQVASETK